MTWARDPSNIMHALALGIVQRVFEDYIEQGVGTREQFASLYLIYAQRRQYDSIEVVAQDLRREFEQWMEQGRTEAVRATIRTIPSSTDPMR